MFSTGNNLTLNLLIADRHKQKTEQKNMLLLNINLSTLPNTASKNEKNFSF